MKIDVHKFLIDLVQLFAENSGSRLLKKLTGEARDKIDERRRRYALR
ncbi:MAG TPA: hypothetical protein VFK25_07370 [Candidatus Binatia bacterium]|nr:hypothetical protein [Candidatus Binatia bacterium]